MTTYFINNANKDIYFTSSGRSGSAPAQGIGNVYELTENITFSTNVYLNLGTSETFHGKGFTINMSGVSGKVYEQ